MEICTKITDIYPNYFADKERFITDNRLLEDEAKIYRERGYIKVPIRQLHPVTLEKLDEE